MAVNDMVVRIIGDSRSVERSFARSSKAAAQFGKEVDSTGRRIDSNAKKLSGFAKGAGVGFIAGSAIVSLKQFVGLAAESEQVLGQTRVALEASGKSWAEYGDTIEDAIKKQSRLGFDDEALLRTFSTFVRQTDDVGEALERNNLAMDVARARFISLEQAASIVTKAALGQAGALRRIGIDAEKGATATELLAKLQREFGGAAEKASSDSSTSFQRTQVAVENLQESIGTLLLPALEVLADRANTAAEFVTNLTDGLRALGKVRIPEIEIPFNITIGGQSLGDLGGKAFNVLKFTPLNPLFGLTIANSIANQFRDQTKAATPNLANQFARDINLLTTNALDRAQKQTKPAKVPSFGEAGFEPIDTGPELAKQFSAGIAGAIARAKQLAGLTVAEGKERIATDKAREAAEKRRDALKKLAEAQAEARRVALEMRQSSQFRALGLDESGGPLAPTIANLSKQLDQLKSRDDLSGKARGTIARIGRVLSGEFGKVTDRTRAAIRDLFQAIRSEFNKQASSGPLTKTTSLNSNKVLAGLGLAPEQVRELRARLSGINSAGLGLAGATRPTGNFTTAGVVVENQNTIVMDGDVVARNTTRSQQKTRRRNPRQKRGPNSGA